jgi:DNA-binding protein HU-beta
MNKADLVAKITKDAGLTKTEATKAVNAFIETVTDALVKGEKVILVGFGTFKVVERKARQGRNPKTGETIKIKAKKSPKFVPGKALKEKVAK